MTAKLSPDSIGLIFTMNAAGHAAEDIADAAGCAHSKVVRYLNAAGIVLGNKGKPKQLNGEYHRIDKVSPGGVFTLFITSKWRGDWGFLVNGVKVPWRTYTNSDN